MSFDALKTVDGPVRALAKAGRVVQDLIFPHHAFDAGSRVASAGLTAPGWAKIAFIEAPVCDGCGMPFDHEMGDKVRCAACEARPRAFARARAACLYDEYSRGLILQFKHADRTDLARLFTLWLARAGAELIADSDVVIPVPVHPMRLIRRRYNQAAEIARPLARGAKLAYWPDALHRTRDESQAGKSGANRRRTAQRGYACPENWRKKVAGKRILLIDDVFTTGATAEACARVLMKAGARQVSLAVIARVREAASPTI